MSGKLEVGRQVPELRVLPPALVLAGGHSVRMGQDKACLDWHGRPLLNHILDSIRPRVASITVVARVGQHLPLLPEEVKVIHDTIPDQGPLVGLLTGLESLPATQQVFVTGCDYPFLTGPAVDFLVQHLGQEDAAVPRTHGQAHPLLALYHPRIRTVINDLITRGERSMNALLRCLKVRWIDEAEWRTWDADFRVLTNVNTPADFATACGSR